VRILEIGLGWSQLVRCAGEIDLRWFGHVERKEDDDWVKKCTRMEVVGKRPRGRPRRTWMSTLKDVMKIELCPLKMQGTEICGEGVSMV
jgi:hypothetical protein